MLKRKRDRNATTAMIMKTSIEVFSKYGFDNATTKMIAKKCNVAESLIIKYFKNKNGLLVAITEDFIRTFISSKKELKYPQQASLEEEILNYTMFTFEDVLHFNKTYKTIIAKSIGDNTFSKTLKKLLPSQENLEFLLKERLEVLKSDNKISQKMDAIKIDQTITFHVFGFYLIGAPLIGLSNEEVREALKEWAMTYARGLN